MKRLRYSYLAIAVVSASIVVASASGAPVGNITATSIAGARLGLPATAYERSFGTTFRKDLLRFPKNYARLVFMKRKVAVVFAPNGKAVEITTWNKTDETGMQIGPCSTVEQLKAAYGRRLKPSEPNTVGSRVYSYTVGKLIFAATGRDPKPGPSKHVTAIALYSGPLNVAGFLALQSDTSAVRCS
jgi:hypothetical protein